MAPCLALLLVLVSFRWAVSQEQQAPADAPAPSAVSSEASKDSTQVVAIKTYMPDYPERARDRGIQGHVVVRVTISEEGKVEKTDVVSGHPLLVDAAVSAAKKFRFKPFIKNGRPAKGATDLSFDFNFRGKVIEKGVSEDGRATSTSKSNLPPNAKGVVPGKLIHQVAPVYPPRPVALTSMGRL